MRKFKVCEDGPAVCEDVPGVCEDVATVCEDVPVFPIKGYLVYLATG